MDSSQGINPEAMKLMVMIPALSIPTKELPLVEMSTLLKMQMHNITALMRIVWFRS